MVETSHGWWNCWRRFSNIHCSFRSSESLSTSNLPKTKQLKQRVTSITQISLLFNRSTVWKDLALWLLAPVTCSTKEVSGVCGEATASTLWKLHPNRPSNSWHTKSWSNISNQARQLEIWECTNVLSLALSLDVSLKLPSIHLKSVWTASLYSDVV